MVDVEEARQQVASARALVADKRAQAEQAQAQLNQQEQSLPSTTSQMALRQRFSGMQGRIQRQVIDKERLDIQEAQGYVRSYKDELGRYESDINATESQINEYERRVEEARRDAREEAKAELDTYKAEFEAANPGEKLIVDWSRLRIKGVESGALMQSLPVEQYNSKIEEINKKMRDVGSTIPQINKELPRGKKIPEVRKDIMGFDLIPMASAMFVQDVERGYVSDKGVYQGVVKPAPTLKERFKESTKDNWISGSAAFVGGIVSQKAFESQQRAFRKTGDVSTLYQSTAIQEAAAQTPDLALRSSPVTRIIYPIAKGTEDIIRNVPKVGTDTQALTKIGYGVLDVGSGALIGSGSYRNIRNTREANILRNAPTDVRGLRFENARGGVDVVFGVKSTQPKGFMDSIFKVRPQMAVSQVEQPFVYTKRGVIFEGGRAYSVVAKQKSRSLEFTSSGFKQSGRMFKTPQAQAVNRQTKIYNEYPEGLTGIRVEKRVTSYSRQTIPADTGIGKIRMRKVLENVGTIEPNRNWFFSDEFVTTQTTQKFKGKDFQDIFFGGMSKQSAVNKDVFNILSGKVDKIRIYNDGTYNPKAILKPNVRGKIRRFRIESKAAEGREGWDLFIMGKGKKSSPEFYQSLYTQEAGNVFGVEAASTVASESINKVIPKNIKSDFNKVLGLSTQTSQVAKSEYWGKGTYERTESINILTPKENVFGISRFVNIPTEAQAQRSGQRVRQAPRQTTKQRESFTSGLNFALGFEELSRERVGFRSKNIQKQRQGQKYRLGQPQAFNWLTGERITPRFVGAFPPSISYKTTGGKVIKQSPGRYLVVVKRYGTDSVIGEAGTLEEAKRMLSSNLRSTLGASGFVTQKGSSRKEDVSDLFGGMFTSAKKDRFRLVQRRGKRLSSRSEVNEIFGFNRRKGGKSKPLKINWW